MEKVVLRNLTDSELVLRLTKLFEEERTLEIEIIRHLREVERRHIHLERGYGSLLAYLIQEFRLSEGSAVRRLEAMRLIEDIPQVEDAIQTGSVSLTNASKLQEFFRMEKKQNHKAYTNVEKLEVFQQIKDKSTRECEKVLKAISPEAMKPRDRTRFVSGSEIEVTCTLPKAVVEKLDRVKNLISHKNPNATYAELLNYMADVVLKKIDPCEREHPRQDAQPAPVARCTNNPDSRQTSTHLKRTIWKKAGGRCEYRDPKTGRRCNSTYMLELDHVYAFGCGGRTTKDNMRLVCRSHNSLAAIQTYGRDKMKAYLPRL